MLLCTSLRGPGLCLPLVPNLGEVRDGALHRNAVTATSHAVLKQLPDRSEEPVSKRLTEFNLVQLSLDLIPATV